MATTLQRYNERVISYCSDATWLHYIAMMSNYDQYAVHAWHVNVACVALLTSVFGDRRYRDITIFKMAVIPILNFRSRLFCRVSCVCVSFCFPLNDNDNDKRLGLSAKADQPDHKKYNTPKIKPDNEAVRKLQTS